MKISKIISGYCPTRNQESCIEVVYTHARGNEFLQTGADCELASLGRCPIMLDCPIRSSAPKVIFE